MLLLHLPPEILRQTFDEIGSSFFHEDLGRLTVCKQWFEFALPTYLKCITLSQKTLRKYTQDSNALMVAAWSEAPRNNLIKKSITALNKDLDQLAIITQHVEDYLPLPTMQALLLVENLRVLVLDLSAGFLNWAGQQGNGRHICPAIGALLCTLRTLHLRMRSICPDVLIPRDPNISLQLSEVVINLSLTEELPGITSAAHSKRCGSQGGGLFQLKADLCEQAEALTTQMAFPKVMRILTHSLPQFETNSLDVLTGKTMILENGSAWDEDGKTVEEDSEAESEIISDDEVSTLQDE
ncbi:hypothetical protein P885DRAFT_71445 [Corynascus similis CBS 632.67]